MKAGLELGSHRVFVCGSGGLRLFTFGREAQLRVNALAFPRAFKYLQSRHTTFFAGGEAGEDFTPREGAVVHHLDYIAPADEHASFYFWSYLFPLFRHFSSLS